MAIEIVCSYCGSAKVSRDAWADWDAGKQAWVLGTVFHNGYCHACGGEASLVERVIPGGGEALPVRG